MATTNCINWNHYFRPRFKHDGCPKCVFLGHYLDWDMYFCPQTQVIDDPIPTLIFRAGSEPSEYISLPFFVHDTLLNGSLRADGGAYSGLGDSPSGQRLLQALQVARELVKGEDLLNKRVEPAAEEETRKSHYEGISPNEIDPELVHANAEGALEEFKTFEAICNDNEGTDIADAWEMLYSFRDELQMLLEVAKAMKAECK
jgi:hypothetical protein